MLDVRREGGTPGSISNRTSSEHVDRNDHGPNRRLHILAARLSRRYDPPEREEAHCAELRARTRRRNESADEFAEYLKNLAQRAYPNADQNMLDNLVVERFREGHNNIELKKPPRGGSNDGSPSRRTS